MTKPGGKCSVTSQILGIDGNQGNDRAFALQTFHISDETLANDQGNDETLPSNGEMKKERSIGPYQEPGRRHPVHQPVHQSGNLSVIVFLTVCAEKRKPILAKDDVVDLLVKTWHDADTWLVGRYVVLPDHLHLFCAPRAHDVPLKKWVKYWKSLASRHWPRSPEQPVWQLDFWDTQLRRSESYAQKWDYVRRNPVRQGLVDDPDDWPFAGELNSLMWHEP